MGLAGEHFVILAKCAPGRHRMVCLIHTLRGCHLHCLSKNIQTDFFNFTSFCFRLMQVPNPHGLTRHHIYRSSEYPFPYTAVQIALTLS